MNKHVLHLRKTGFDEAALKKLFLMINEEKNLLRLNFQFSSRFPFPSRL
jgi:hypothetical protein